MSRVTCIFVVAVLLGLLSISTQFETVEAWGVEGHAIIAQVAFNRLSTTAQNAILKYIAPAAGVQNISSDPDSYDHTKYGEWSAPLHFVNMPTGATEFILGNADCPDPPSCVVAAIMNFTDYLQKDKKNPEWPHEEPSPVSFLIHFVGDCHQPLHVGWASDLGGTTVSVEFFSTYTNLHDVWDTYIIEKWQGETSSAIQDIEDLISQNKTLVTDALELTTPSQWANQSFQLVRTDVYNYDPQDRIEFDLLELSKDHQAAHIFSEPYLGTNYYDHNLPIVQIQLLRGSVRLAVLLESLFGN